MSKSIIESLNLLIRRVPGRFWFAVGGCLLAAFWMQQHDARIRQQAGLQQLRNETSAQVAALRRQAAEEVQQANVTNARAVAKLEQRRQEAEQQDRQLAAQLESLRKQAQIQADEVATLPISEIVTRVAAQLGLKAEDVASGKAAGMAKSAASAPLADCHPEETQATKDPGSSGAMLGHGPCQKQTTEILRFAQDDKQSARSDRNAAQPADIAKNAISAPPVVTGKKETAGILRSAQDDSVVALPLTASGARKVEASLVALDACRAESGIQARQVSNCEARAAADEAAIARLNGSVASLNQALQAKDKVLVEQQSEYKAELRAARGTFLGRLARLTEHVAIGVGVGVAIGVAVK